MKRLFIHIGSEKTGTTTLQQFCVSNSEVLKNHNLSYPCEPDQPYFEYIGHFPVAAALFDERQDFTSAAKFEEKHRVFDVLNAEILASDRDVILSSEHFSSRFLTKSRIEQLYQSLPGREKKIICYIRRQDDLHLAAYATHVVYGRREPINHEDANLENTTLNYTKYLSLWADIFGRENVIVRKYDRTKLLGGDIRRDFLSLFGISDLSGFALGADQNISLDARQVEILRQINQHLPTLDDASWEQVDFSREVRLRIQPLLPTGQALDDLLGPQERREILTRFREANLELERKFLTPGALADWMPEAIGGGATPAVAPPAVSDLAQITAKLAWELRNQDLAVHELMASVGQHNAPSFAQCLRYWNAGRLER